MYEGQIEGIRKRVAVIKKYGEEWTNFDGSSYEYGTTVYEYDRLTESDCGIIAHCESEELADFIANAREDITALLAEIERLSNERGRLIDED